MARSQTNLTGGGIICRADFVPTRRPFLLEGGGRWPRGVGRGSWRPGCGCPARPEALAMDGGGPAPCQATCKGGCCCRPPRPGGSHAHAEGGLSLEPLDREAGRRERSGLDLRGADRPSTGHAAAIRGGGGQGGVQVGCTAVRVRGGGGGRLVARDEGWDLGLPPAFVTSPRFPLHPVPSRR